MAVKQQPPPDILNEPYLGISIHLSTPFEMDWRTGLNILCIHEYAVLLSAMQL
jgi:hypothetical protein